MNSSGRRGLCGFEGLPYTRATKLLMKKKAFALIAELFPAPRDGRRIKRDARKAGKSAKPKVGSGS